MSRTFLKKRVLSGKVAIASTDEKKVQDNRAGRRRVDPTYGFATSPKVGSGATVGTLQIGYP
jgi:hypothetical protein